LDNPVLEITIIFLLLIVNGIFAMSEIAIITARKARLQQRAESGDHKAKQALDLASNPNQFLSTVQIGITLVGILAGAFGGATIAEELGAYLSKVTFLAPYSEAIGVGLIVLGVTYFSLIIGELVPKRIALNHAERIAASIAAPMQKLSIIVSPLVSLLTISADGVIRLLGLRSSGEPPITEEEIRVLIEQGTQVGVFEETEQDMIEGIFRMGERRVGALMTPRMQIDWIALNDSPEEIGHKVLTSQHSRFPVAENNLDNLIGIVDTKDILAQSLSNQPIDLRALIHEPLYIPEKMPVLQVLELLKQENANIALIVDEYGGLQGLITTNDIMGDIVGYIALLGKEEEPKAVLRDDGSFLVDGLLDVDKFKELLNIENLPDEKSGNYQTVGGFVITYMGKIPSAGECFEWEDFHFEIIDMDRYRVDKVMVKSINQQSSHQADIRQVE
jgi:putative hemolysin